MNLTPNQIRSLSAIARQQIKAAGTLTIRRVEYPDNFDSILDSMPDETVIREIAGEPELDHFAAFRAAPPSDPLIPKWISEGETAFRSGIPCTQTPGGRKGQHWLTGWNRAKAALDQCSSEIGRPVPDLAECGIEPRSAIDE